MNVPLPSRVPHHLLIHLDFDDNVMELRYSYPFSRPHALPEQVLRMAADVIPAEIKSELVFLREQLMNKLPEPTPVRMPSQLVRPEVRPGFLTVVIQDGTRRLPVARLYVMEVVERFGSRREVELRLDPGDWSATQLASWRHLRQSVRGLVWKDYLRKFT